MEAGDGEGEGSDGGRLGGVNETLRKSVSTGVKSKSMEMHKGTTRLTFTRQALEGDYYISRGRGTTGSIRLTRK